MTVFKRVAEKPKCNPGVPRLDVIFMRPRCDVNTDVILLNFLDISKNMLPRSLPSLLQTKLIGHLVAHIHSRKAFGGTYLIYVMEIR